MTHDPALEAHEQRETAEHAAHLHDPYIGRVSITVALLAVLAASVGSLENLESGRAITSASEAVLAQDRATDAWNEFQADSLKRHIYGLAADAGGPRAGRYQSTAQQQAARQTEIRKAALQDEAERTKLMALSAAHEHRHHWLTGAATLLEIGIAVCTVAIITRRRGFWFAAIGLGVVGAALVVAAYA